MDIVCPLCGDQIQGSSPLERHLGRRLESVFLFALPQDDSGSGNDLTCDSDNEVDSEHSDRISGANRRPEGRRNGYDKHWRLFYNLKQEDLTDVDGKELERQYAFHEIINSE